MQGIALVSTGGQWNINWIEIKPINALRFKVKPSMTNTFLPERKTILEDFLKGKTYQLTFDASTILPTTFAQFQVMLEKNGAPYDKYLNPQTVILNSGLKTFTYTFTMNSTTYNDARIAFNMGMNSGVIAIDNVTLKQVP